MYDVYVCVLLIHKIANKKKTWYPNTFNTLGFDSM